jgi:probable F420-dependent oxidoreductase
MRVETALPVGKIDPGLRQAEERLDLRRVSELAREVEALGYDGLVALETKTDPFLPLTLAAAVTERVRLTTAVAIAFPRSPMVTALTAWGLQSLSRGRFTLGLGTQVKGHNERRYSVRWTRPGPRLREYVAALRAIWDSWQTGRPLDFRGEHYTFTLMVPLFDPGPIENPEIPIQLAAVNPFTCRLAGEIANGIRPHPICTRKYIDEVMLPAIEAGAHKAGRKAGEVEVCVSPLIATAADAAAVARRARDVRARIAFYASTRTYRRVFELHGWGRLTDELSNLSRSGRWEEMPALVSDEMLETIAVVAPHDSVAAECRRRYADAATAIEFGIPLRTNEDRALLTDLVRELHDRH